MQISKVEVTSVHHNLHLPVQMGSTTPIDQVTCHYVRMETMDGLQAWGCMVAHPLLTGEDPQAALTACLECADLAVDLHPTNIEYSLAQLAPLTRNAPSVLCAFDLAFHDLLGKISGLPLYKMLGGYRKHIQTSITIPLAPTADAVELAQEHARSGFRIIKIKGGLDPDEDITKVQSIKRALPNMSLRLDADGGYNIREALQVTKALVNQLEMLEQPTPPENLESLLQVTRESDVPILADQSVSQPDSALQVASRRAADGISCKVAASGGILPARQIDSIARAARLTTMVSCVIEPALLIAAGLGLALSSPSVHYGDLDGHLHLESDPSSESFVLKEGTLIASEDPGLGCTVNL